MNAALAFQIGLNDCAQAIQWKFTFAGAWESFQSNQYNSGYLVSSVSERNGVYFQRN